MKQVKQPKMKTSNTPSFVTGQRFIYADHRGNLNIYRQYMRAFDIR